MSRVALRFFPSALQYFAKRGKLSEIKQAKCYSGHVFAYTET